MFIKRILNKQYKALTYLLLNKFAQTQTWITRSFHILDGENRGYITKNEILQMLDSQGVLSHYSLNALIQNLEQKSPQECIYFQQYQEMTNGLHFLKKVFESDLTLPCFERFSRNFKDRAQYVKDQPEFQHGKTAQYIPTLKNSNPQYFAASFCSNNGQYVEYGDTKETFSIQSISKVVSYGYLYDLIGEEVHKYIGEEPSGLPFNAPMFDQKGRPHNPMINSGAIMVAALILENGKGLDDVLEFYQRATRKNNSQELGSIDYNLYIEEKLTGYTNHALAYLMLANSAFPIGNKTVEEMKDFAQRALDLYFQMCSINVNVESLSRFGAMCSNNGINPCTGERILKTETVKAITTFMLTCGMYNGAGKFTKNLGVPCKSGVSGGLLTVVPGIGSIASFGPKLNDEGNSVKGIGLIQQIGSLYNNFNLFHKDLGKRDVENRAFQMIIKSIIASISCASIGDIEGLIRLKNLNINLDQGDYDKRKPLHLASSGGHLEVVKFLVLSEKVDINAKDRWGATPLNDAKCEKVKEFLISEGAVFGNNQVAYNQLPINDAFSDDKYRLLYAAYENDLTLIKSLLILGVNVNCYDYDGRTALSIAASEGNLDIVKYLVYHNGNVFHKDARGNTPLDDAKREGRTETQQFLENEIQKRK